MKKILVFALVLAASFAFKADTIDNLNDLVNAHKKAVGSSKLAALKGIKMQGIFNLGIAQIPTTVYYSEGNFRVEYYYDEKTPAVSVYTKSKAWKTTPWDLKTVVDLTGEELYSLQEQAQLLGLLYNFEAIGFKEATLMPETDPKAETQVVSIKREDDATYLIYVNKENHLIAKMDKTKFTGGKYQTRTIFYENYQEYKGVQIPTLLREESNGKDMSSFSYNEIETGLKLSKNLFTKP